MADVFDYWLPAQTRLLETAGRFMAEAGASVAEQRGRPAGRADALSTAIQLLTAKAGYDAGQTEDCFSDCLNALAAGCAAMLARQTPAGRAFLLRQFVGQVHELADEAAAAEAAAMQRTGHA